MKYYVTYRQTVAESMVLTREFKSSESLKLFIDICEESPDILELISIIPIRKVIKNGN